MVVAENSAVSYGRTTIHYGIRRSSRRKTVGVAVDPDHGVILTAPEEVPVPRLDAVVHERAGWIVSKLREIGRGEAAAEKQFVSGESFFYLGRSYRLRVLKRARPGEVRLHRGWLEAPVDRGLDDRRRAGAVRESLISWYRTHATQRLPERVERWHRKVGVPTPPIAIRDQQKRWGSCTSGGQLLFNWRVIQAPMSLVDYVVAHELVHLIEKDHTKAFWSKLGKVMPDYELRQDRLRLMGRRLEW